MVPFQRLLLLSCAVVSVAGDAIGSFSRPLQGTTSIAPQKKAVLQSRSPFLRSIVGHTSIRGGQDVAVVQKGKIHLSTGTAVLFGALLAFNSGYVNGACLSGILSSGNTKQAAAAVTGAWTNSALGAAGGNWDQFAFNGSCILSYVAGSLIYGLMCPSPVPFQLDRKSTAPAFLVGAALLFASGTRAAKGDDRSFVYLALAANGIQNSITSSITSNLVRSAHFSGISSDIGTFLGQLLRGNKQNSMKLKVFCLLALSFWLGGFVSLYATTELASTSLLVSGALYLVIGASLLELYFY